jgi:competence protein ComEA
MMRTLLSVFVLTTAVAGHALAQARPVQSAAQAAKPAKAAVMVNLNTATATDLQELPGVGPTVAARIVAYRQTNGPFKKIEELMNVQGVGEKSFLKLRALLTVSGKTDPAGQP